VIRDTAAPGRRADAAPGAPLVRYRRRVSAPAPIEVGRPVPDAVLLEDGDREVRLSELWRNGPAVLLFLRHFG